jgi:hypothetical protein
MHILNLDQGSFIQQSPAILHLHPPISSFPAEEFFVLPPPHQLSWYVEINSHKLTSKNYQLLSTGLLRPPRRTRWGSISIYFKIKIS